MTGLTPLAARGTGSSVAAVVAAEHDTTPPTNVPLSLRSVANQVAGSMCRGLDAIAPGRILSCLERGVTAALLLTGVGNVGARPASIWQSNGDVVGPHERMRPELDACLGRVGAGDRPAARVLAHCYGTQARKACLDGVDPYCLMTLQRSIEGQDGAEIPEVEAQHANGAFHRLEQQHLQSEYYTLAMQALVGSMEKQCGCILATRDDYTPAELRTMLEGSVEDPLEILGVAGKALHEGIRGLADDMYQRDPDWLDRTGRQRFQEWLDSEIPDISHPDHSDADLSERQVQRMLHELARYLNHRARA